MKFQFDWDTDKADKNIGKHNVSFDEAVSVFDDPMLIAVIDDEHSIDEERYITVGLSKHGRLLMVAHTDREGQIGKDESGLSVHVRQPKKRNDFMQTPNNYDDYELRDEYDLSEMTVVAKGRYAEHRRTGKNVIFT